VRCNQCDYPLWNLRARLCPECGTAFLPSGRSYVPNSVRFCCTNCGQDYYGTDSNGHLVPASFDCVKCGEPQTMDEMVMLPTEGVTEEQTKVFVMPWLDASYLGKPVRAWYATMGLVVSSPTRLCRAIPDGASVARAWSFAIFTILVLMAFGLGPITLLKLANSSSYGFRNFMSIAGLSAMFYIIVFVGIVIVVGLWGLLAHGILKATGPTSGTIGRTYQAMLYSLASTFLAGVPGIGPYGLWPIWLLWWIISCSIMLRTLQKVHGFRAFLASALLPLVMIVIVVAFIIIGFTRMFSATTMLPLPSSFNSASTQAITSAITSYRSDNTIDGPPHAISLVVDGYLSSGNELMSMSTNTSWMVMVPGTSTGGSGPTYLSQLGSSMGMTTQQMQGAATQAAATLTSNTIAHRLGDFVYTYHGISPTENDGSLWLVIFYPDPALNAMPGFGENLHMGLVDGSMLTIDASTLTTHLVTQNAARSTAGLPPLPDPSIITTSQPALDPG